MTHSFGNIFVMGAGAWGTALAQVLSGDARKVTLYARDPGLAESINQNRRNDMYLPNVTLKPGIRATADVADAGTADAVLIVTPTQFVRDALSLFAPHLKKETVLINASKGIEISTGKLISGIAAELCPHNPYAVLSGPTFAHEVAAGLPAAVTLATHADEKTARSWAESLSSPTFRPYVSHDPVGAEITGALKNVIAIACGIVEGKGLGQNARAAVMTRGMAEIRRFGTTWGAAAESFLGLSGIGDLTLTCHSVSSRNFSLGLALGQGKKLEDILRERKTVAEGVATARAVMRKVQDTSIDMPICDAVNQILHRGGAVDDIIRELLARHLKPEGA